MQGPALRAFVTFAVLLNITVATRSADPPSASPEQQILDKWLGQWRASYKQPRSDWNPEEKTGTATITTRRVVGGQFVQETSEHSDKTNSMLLLNYDAQRKSYRGWWFNSDGLTSESTGRWDPAAKTMTWTTVGDGPFTTTVKHRLVTDDKIEWNVTVKDNNGKVLFLMDGTNVRVREPRK
jgi:hypothetical protein